MEFNHKPVLLQECIEGLNIRQNKIYVDGTLGGAGHSKEIAKKLNNTGMLIGIDRDEEALKVAKERLSEFTNITFVHNNHDNIKEILSDLKIEGVDGILLDLGVSSYQIDEASRGFSYMQEAKLDMRMDKTQTLTAEDIVNNYTQKELSRIIYEYGEEKFANRIAQKICEVREKQKIETTKQLVEIIESAIPEFAKHQDGHPAKRTFQAIRIEVNDEIKPLYNTVINSINALNKGGRLCIITFHSLEDRAVKNAYTDALRKMYMPKGIAILCMQ